MTTGKTTKPAAASRPFNAGTYLRDEADVAAYLEAVLEDGDARVVPVALRTVTEAMGGMSALAVRTGLSRETLSRTLSAKGTPRLDTLARSEHRRGGKACTSQCSTRWAPYQ